MFSDLTFRNRFWWLYLIVLLLGVILFFVLIFCNKCCCNTIIDVTTNVEPYDSGFEDVVDVIEEDPMELRDDISIELDNRISNEGSGYGALTFSLIWNTTDDLDIWVRQPNGNDICYYNTRKPNEIGGNSFRRDESTNGELDIDYNANGSALSTSPVEHIIIQKPELGKYIISIHCYKKNTSAQSIKYKLIQKNIGGDEKYWEGELIEEKSRNIYRTHFELNS